MRSHLFKEPCHDHPADPVIDELTAEILQQLANQDLAALAATLAPVADAELVSVFERLTLRQRAVIFRLLPKETAVAVFDALDPALQGDLLEGLHDTEVARLFAELDPDDRAWLLEEVPAVLATRLLRDLPGSERALTAALLGYPQGGVGRRMTPEYVSVRERATVAIALDRVRDRLADAETVYTIPVLDNARRIVGIVSLRELLAADPNAEISTLMQEAHTAKAADSAEEAARRCTDLSLLAVGATLTVQVLEVFEATLEQVTVLALFVPLLIGTGGNTGNQAATTVTRALALGDVRPRDILRVLTRELRTGSMLGLLLGTLGFSIASLIYSIELGLVIGLTLLAVCTIAAAVGGCMPLLARAVKVDPAVFSNPFISTFVDATGLIVYFVIARAVFGL